MQILKYIQFYPSNPMCCSDGASREENAAKLLKVAWLTLPLGIFITIGACFFVLWWQGLSYSNPYAQAIFINGTFLIIYGFFLIQCYLDSKQIIYDSIEFIWQVLHAYWSSWRNLCIYFLRTCFFSDSGWWLKLWLHFPVVLQCAFSLLNSMRWYVL